MQNITTTINDIKDVYTLAVVAYALQLANHTLKDSVLDILASTALETGTFFNLIRGLRVSKMKRN